MKSVFCEVFGPIVLALQAGWQEKRSVKEMPFATKPECNEQKAKERWWIQHAEKSRDRKIAAGRKILAYKSIVIEILQELGENVLRLS